MFLGRKNARRVTDDTNDHGREDKFPRPPVHQDSPDRHPRPTEREVWVALAYLLEVVDVKEVDVVVRLERVVKLKLRPTVAHKLAESLKNRRLGATGDEEVKGGYEVMVDIGENPNNCLLCRNAVDFVQAVEKKNVGPLRAFNVVDGVEGFDDELDRLDIHCFGEQAIIFFKCSVHK